MASGLAPHLLPQPRGPHGAAGGGAGEDVAVAPHLGLGAGAGEAGVEEFPGQHL